MQDFEKLAATESERMGKLLGRLLKKRYPSLHCEDASIDFDELLAWDLWPNFIKIYGNYVSNDVFSDPYKRVLVCLLLKLFHLF